MIMRSYLCILVCIKQQNNILSALKNFTNKPSSQQSSNVTVLTSVSPLSIQIIFIFLQFLPSLAMVNIGIKHVFSCINIRQVPREVLKTEAGGRGFQHLPRDLANVNALKKTCSIAIIA